MAASSVSVGSGARPALLLGMGDWHFGLVGEGPGSYWQHCHVHLHTLGSSSVATNTKRESSEQHDIFGNGIFVFTNDCSAAST